MPSIRFANVLLEISTRAARFPTLYYIADRPLTAAAEAGVWNITKTGTVDFTTYFNALSVLKLRRYTRATAFRLHIDVKSAHPVTVTQTVAKRLSSIPERVSAVCATVDSAKAWQTVTLDLDVDDSTVLSGFTIDTQGPTQIRNGWYEVVFEGEARDVELSVVTTTFRKEPFIEKNLAIIKHDLLESGGGIADHLTVHVIDNGRTLDVDKLSSNHIVISPNENVGGAGGFARGMIESLEQSTPATHVLLMDDDVEVAPESILRTYHLLRIVNDEYKDAFISGAMLNLEDVEVFREDTGYIIPGNGMCSSAKRRKVGSRDGKDLLVSHLTDIIYTEVFDERFAIPEDAHQYAAWWYCCIPAALIREHGLPLPLFVRYDDVEYGIRCHPRFMTMNGICVWHAKFEDRYNPAVERYQTVRNMLIDQKMTGIVPSDDALIRQLGLMIALDLYTYNYTDARLALHGFEDFLKGPDFLSTPDARHAFMLANRDKERFVPFDELTRIAEASGIRGFDPELLTTQMIEGGAPRNLLQKAFDYLMANGQRIALGNPLATTDDADGYGIVPNAGWGLPSRSANGHDVLIAIDPVHRKGAIRTKDLAQYREIRKRLRRDLAYYRKHAKHLAHAYAAAVPELTSIGFWKSYLGMQ